MLPMSFHAVNLRHEDTNSWLWWQEGRDLGEWAVLVGSPQSTSDCPAEVTVASPTHLDTAVGSTGWALIGRARRMDHHPQPSSAITKPHLSLLALHHFSISSTTCPPPAAKETMTCHFSFHLNTCRILIHISKYSRFLSASDTSAQFQCQTLWNR